MGDFSLDLKATIAIIALILTLIIALYFQWWRNRKNLSYEILSDTALLTSDEKIREKIQILYEGTPVKDVRLFILKIINNGSQPIKSDDFEKPLSFVFSEDAQILSIETVSVNPDNLDVSVTSQLNKLSIAPILLNSGDFFQLKASSSHFEK